MYDTLKNEDFSTEKEDRVKGMTPTDYHYSILFGSLASKEKFSSSERGKVRSAAAAMGIGMRSERVM